MIRLRNFEHLVCKPDITIREVLQRINNESSQVYQIVIDNKRRVIGTVTDGDVRRAMLKGITLEDRVDSCMNSNPIIGQINDGDINRAKLRQTGFLPIIDSIGEIESVLTQAKAPLVGRALIMAGGFGKRLGNQTRDIPKPLLTVGEKPILARILDQLEEGGVESITISVYYRAEQVEAFVNARNNKAKISFIREPEPLGTAGSLMLMPGIEDETTIVVNGDVVSQVDFNHLWNFHAEHGNDGTIAVSRYNVQIPFGVLKVGEDGLFAGMEEKPTNSYFVAAGIYILSPQFSPLVQKGIPIDMPQLLEAGRQAGLRIGIAPLHEYWRDIGHPDDLAMANSENSS